MSKYKILVLDPIAREGLDMIDADPDFSYEERIGLKGEDLRRSLGEFDAAIVRSGVKITAESLAGNKKLRAIARAGVGTDNIDKNAATRAGIIVMNTPAGNTLSTAEHTMALMMALSRNVAPAYQSLIEGRWDRKHFMGTQLADKTLGIIGMGRIGREVAARAKAFEMRVIAFDPFLTEEQANKLGVTRVAVVHDMLPKVDYLTVHTPLTSETEHLIGMKELSLLKPGVRLINCARGGIYDEAALAAGLESGQIGGVALDVFEKEPCTDSPLFGKPNVVCTPHLGASTEEAQTQVAIEGIELLMNYLRRGEIRHAVNVAALDPQTLEAIRSYLEVAWRLGLFASQWVSGTIDHCRLQYRGDVAGKDTKLLNSAFCAGLLQRAMPDEVNIINAELLLRERGIELIENRNPEPGAFRSSITVELTSGAERYTAGATVFGTAMPRLISLNDCRLEAFLDGRLMIFIHTDQPGIIGAVGTIFGKSGVNIAQMAVGRAGTDPGGLAVGILNLDSTPPAAAIESVLQIGAIQKVHVIELPPAGQLPPWLA